jgi:hypothetical protein
MLNAEIETLDDQDEPEDDHGILYCLAASPEDYAEARALALSEGFDAASYKFPTVLAFEDQTMIGALGTQDNPEMIVAGPLVVRQDRPRYWTIVRLFDGYEAALRYLKMESYIFSTDDPKMASIVDRLWGLKPYSRKHGTNWYIKRL